MSVYRPIGPLVICIIYKSDLKKNISLKGICLIVLNKQIKTEILYEQ